MIRIFHCADIHLDSPFTLYNPREAQSRRRELWSAFNAALLFARQNRADLFIISGDLFDTENVTFETREGLLREFSSMKDCRFFISPGNHDPFTGSSVYGRVDFPPNVHIFGEGRSMISIDELGVDVYGFGFGSAVCDDHPVTGHTIQNPEKINILVTHGDITSTNSASGTITKQEIAASGFDYIALGHIHKSSGVLNENGVHYAYPGCLEGRSFDETGAKGGLFGTIEKGKVNLQFVPLSRRRYEVSKVDLEGCADKSEALARIREATKTHDEKTIFRLILTGTVEDSILIAPDDTNLERVEIIDQTRLVPSIAGLASSPTVKGVFYREMAGLLSAEDPDSKQYALLLQAMKYGLGALDSRNIIDFAGIEE